MAMRWPAVVLGVAVLVAGCGGGGGPRYATVVTSAQRDGKVAKTTFPPDTPRIYVVFTLADLPTGATLKSVWYAEKVEGLAPNTKLDEGTLRLNPGDREGAFWFTRTTPWPVGEYRVELYINDALKHTARFKVEGAASAPGQQPVPFAGRGWTRESDDTYANARHGLRITVPEGWTVGDEAGFSERILWTMSKLDGSGTEKVGFNIAADQVGQKSAEEFYNAEVASFRQGAGPDAGKFEVTPLGQTATPGVYEMLFRRTDRDVRGRDPYYVRDGWGYVIVLRWAGDATADELAALDAVRAAMGLPAQSQTPGTSTTPGATPPAAAARVEDVVVTADETVRVNATSFPAASTDKVFVLFSLADAPAGTAVRCLWIAERTTSAPPDTKIDEVTLQMGGAITRGTCSLSRPTNGWPVGDYRVEISVGGTPGYTARFSMTGEGAPQSGGPRITSVTVALDQDAANPRTVFSPDDPRIYVVVRLADLRPDTKIRCEWFAEKTAAHSGETRLYVGTLDTKGRLTHAYCWISRPSGGWSVGSYRVDVYLDDALAQRVPFQVQ